VTGVTISYAEYVPDSSTVNFAPIMERAERRARLYSDSPFTILRREWECVATGKATDPAVAVVYLFYRTP
jgi:hypothetical protein